MSIVGEKTNRERDHHSNNESDETTGQLPIGREHIRSIRPHEDRCTDLEAPLAEKSRLSCSPSDGKEQAPSIPSCQCRALPARAWSQLGSSLHGATEGLGSSSSSGSSGFGCYSPDSPETTRRHPRCYQSLNKFTR